jgi:hypothetical protein
MTASGTSASHLAGYTVVRFTWRQLVRQPDTVAATLAGLLAADRGRPVARLAQP